MGAFIPVSLLQVTCLWKLFFGDFVSFFKGYVLLENFAIPPKEQILENEGIRIGLDFELGGSIGYLADPKHKKRNLVNTIDQGREIQMSFYANPNPYNPPTADYPDGACSDLFIDGDWPWNPIGAGNVDFDTSDILEFEKQSDSKMTITTRPLQWACHKLACECTFEKTLQLMGDLPVVKVTATLKNARTDIYDETALFDQELPAVYTNGFLHRLVTYTGSKPFQDDPVDIFDASFNTEIPFPWIPGRFSATENWAAFVDENDWGLGVINPNENEYLSGFFQPKFKGCGGSKTGQTGYIAPVGRYALPRDITFTYEYYLVLGSVKYIRSFAKTIMFRYGVKEGVVTNITLQSANSTANGARHNLLRDPSFTGSHRRH